METNQRLQYVLSTLVRFRKLWIVPAVICFLLALIYVFAIRTDVWSARQSLIVRDDLLGQAYKPGHFDSLESMKSAQETILEVARKPQVIRNVLSELGPAKKNLFSSGGEYPDQETIEDVQGMIELGAPNGAEFGKTEMVILGAKATSPERSKRFIELLLDQIDLKLGEVRGQRLQSMEQELLQARDGAAMSLQKSTTRLREMEGKLGTDVAAMRGLNSEQASDNSARLELRQLQLEKRAAQTELDQVSAAAKMLMAARKDPDAHFATSSELLRAQPRLEALQKSLASAQQIYATNLGRYQPEHPLVISSRETIDTMHRQIFQELESLTKNVDSKIAQLQTRITRLDGMIDGENQRLLELGAHRVDHLTINAEVKKKTEILNRIGAQLGEVQALRMASGRVQWLTRVDAPQVSTRPDGLGKKAVVMAGAVCGLMFGLGLVMLLAPPMEKPLASQVQQSQPQPQRPTQPQRPNSVRQSEPLREPSAAFVPAVAPAKAGLAQTEPMAPVASTPTTANMHIRSESSAYRSPDSQTNTRPSSRDAGLGRSSATSVLRKEPPVQSINIPNVSTPTSATAVGSHGQGQIAEAPTAGESIAKGFLKDVNLAESMRRASKLRPVDLARAARDIEGPNQEGRPENRTTAPSAEAKPGVRSEREQNLRRSGENPFLKNLPGRKPGAEANKKPSDVAPIRQSASPKPVAGPVPDVATDSVFNQIQLNAIADSLANFNQSR